MSKKDSFKKNIYWYLIALIVLIIPVTYFLFFAGFNNKANNANNETQKITGNVDKYYVPKINEQPTDTLVTNKEIPIHTWQTKEGIKVVFVPTEKLPIIDVDVTFDAGSARDGKKHGIANLTAKLLDQGTLSPKYNADEIAIKFEDVGAIYKNITDRDRTRFLLRTLSSTKELDNIINLFSSVLSSPSFNKESIETTKGKTIVELKYNDGQIEKIAKKTIFKNLYKDHPYAYPILGTTKTIKNITYDDIKNFHEKFYVANNAVITIVGGIHRDKARNIASTISSKIPLGKKADTLPNVFLQTKGKYNKVDFPTSQSYVLLGQICCSFDDPNYFSIKVGNQILGGNVVSRLFKEIRVKEGLSYDIASFFLPAKKKGPLLIRFHTKNDSVEEVILKADQIIDNFIKNGPSENEVKKAINFLKRDFPLDFENNAETLAIVSRLSFYGLPLNFYDTYIENLEKISVEDVKKTFQSKLNSNKMVKVVVGGKTSLQE